MMHVVQRDTEADEAIKLIAPKGYPAERHKVLTRDGFVLTNFRIPHGRSGPGGKAMPGSGADRQPVLLIHGISLSSTCWVINDIDESLAFILADEGYDVWMMNTRGNTFSREHAEYEDNNPRFWQFSWDDFAHGDLPATIAYIKSTTNAKKVHVLGHSQGGTAGLAYLSRKPEAAKDIGVLLAVAPVVYAKYLESPTLVAFSYQANEYLFVSGPMQAVFLGGLCQVPSLIPVCTASTESMFGGSLKYWKVWPSPTSYYNALHWGQIFNEPEPKFMAFNYGPEYDLTKIKAPVVLFTAGRDVLAAPKDMSLVRERLASGGSLAGVHETESFGHMDYIW
ncbi:Alpha/Beta hydrolase protein [Dunaliella salina]|uniref:Alpha/Beta hydrolase protein n=1 Tax=Dunaliella salina TaxID=3046 RepID=A0ABQ7G176_DUNSA|nr:Alpha/Beta hydrolase protein [Dunaliella salina]|eukprot:KAF5828326.1 Alpha/Beta hydrolase protein [Dunaliella salina]